MFFYDNNIKFRYINKLKKSNDGFTLVEMVVTLVVLGILMALSAMGILAWQDWSRFNKANEYAQTLFIAGQNQLSEYETTGKLAEFEERLKRTGVYLNTVELESIFYEEGKAYSEDSVWISENRGKICYAKCEAGDYEKYINGENISSSAKVVFELLEEYVFDPSILNNPICIEFSAEDAQVFSVSYSDANKSFIYSSTDSLRGEVCISNRWEDYRKDRMVGYYGVDTLSSTTKYGKPVISNVRLNNEETLDLSFKLSKYSYATNQLVYDIDVYDKEATNKPKMRISLDGSSLKNRDFRQEIECDITRYNYSNNSEFEEYLGSVPVLAWVESDKTVRVVLDAVDLQATTALYASEIDLIKSNSMASTNFSDTYSFHRFGIDADEIYCTVKAHGANYRTSARKTSNKSNVYFAGVKKDKSEDAFFGKIEKTKYTIKNGRHLFNVRYVEDVADNYSSDIKTFMPSLTGDLCYFEYKLLEDINWNDFIATGNYYDSNGIVVVDSHDEKIEYNPEVNVKTFAKNYFPSFKRLRAGDVFYSENKTIKGIRITQLNNDLQGIYIEDNSNDIDVNENNSNSNNGVDNNSSEDIIIKPTGLFVSNYGTIHNVIIDDVIVNGENHVGSFCGDNLGFLYELKVENTDNVSVIAGVTNVGGVAGYNIGVKDEIVLSKLDKAVISLNDLENNAKIIGDVYVGGIIGTAKLSANCDISIEISDCKNYGRIECNNGIEKDETAYIGGILGFVANYYGYNENNQIQDIDESRIKVFDCVFSSTNTTFDFDEYTSDPDSIPEVILDKMKGRYVGGIVGYNYHGTIQNCGSDEDADDTATLYGYEYVGGVVGFNQGKILGAPADAEDIFDNNKTNVIGYSYVGGIVGCNADTKTDLSEEDNIGEEYVEVEVSELKNLNIQVSDMDNSAIVYALEGYAGGISGYNKGWLYNSLFNAADDDEGKVYSKEYAGGIAGYNNGLIGDTNRVIDENDFTKSVYDGTPNVEENKVSIRPFVVGNNYVGGVVGYNDEEAIIEDYNVSKGHVRGNYEDSYYVGGYVGLNTSVDLLMDDSGKEREHAASLDEVTGQYFVGGYIGGNIINTKRYKDEGGNTQPVEPEQPVDPVDPEPEEPVDPNPPVKPEEPAIEGAYGSLVPQGDVRSDEEWDYATVNLKVVNNTDVTIEMYEVDFSEAPYEFEVNSPWGIIYNEDTKIARLDKDYWISILPGESNSTPGFNIKAKKGQLEAILKKNFIIKIIQDGVLSLSNSIKATKEPFELEIRHKHHWWESGVVNQGTAHGQYNIFITKNSPDYYKNWRIEIDLKDGQILEANHATIARQEGNKIIISNESYNGDFYNVNTVMFEIQIKFDKQTDIDNFVNAHYVLHVGDGNGNDDAYVYDSDNDNKEDEDTPDSDLPDSEVGIPEIPEGIVAKYQSDKVASQINATAFVGGYAGYNLFVSNDNTEDRLYTDELQNALISKVKQLNTLTDKYNLINNVEEADFDISQPIRKSNVTLVLNGDVANQDNIASVDSIIAGDICVGGVIGYNAKYTKLYVRDMRDYSSVIAREALSIDEQYGRNVDYNNQPVQYEYSYVGGITGKVLDSTVLDNCSVASSVNVGTKGTYIGGLCEINNGKVVRCYAGNVGDSSGKYIGGIVGINNKTGIVSYCNIADSALEGKNVVGGVAAENLGIIYKTVVDKIKINVNGEETSFVTSNGSNRIDGVCGAIAAYNSTDGKVYVGYNLFDVEINSKGYYAGGIVGVNQGKLSSIKDKTSRIEISGFVIGLGDVGGVVGKNNGALDTCVRYYSNKATVSALNGDAGGIIGNNASNSSVVYCDNEGMVSAAGSGNAGGIVADNFGLIQNCNDYVSVTSQNGFSGGITANNHNDARIVTCSVAPKKDDNGEYISSDKIEFSSRNIVGGITACNDGEIDKCFVAKLDVYNQSSDVAGNAGAVAGTNNGTIIFDKGIVVDDCLVGTMTNGSSIGGVVGVNSNTGIINGFDWGNTPTSSTDSSIINCILEFKNNSAEIANMGGVAGKNLGCITYCSVNGCVNGNLGDSNTGIGGIAGTNGSAGVDNEESIIEYCTFDGRGFAEGTAQNIANLGGITGINYEDGKINKCYIALYDDASIVAGNDNTSVANTGGLAGLNYGEIKDCDNYNITKNVSISGYGGYQGGIAGRNEISGKIISTTSERLSTNSNWTITSYNNGNTSASGGIAGYYVVGGNLGKVDNYATIAAENCHGNHDATSGGIIGVLYNPTATNYKVFDCINYGEVRSGARAGGIIGTVSTNGITLKDCINFGKISSEKSGGIVSCITNISKEDEVFFDSCINHGEIVANKYDGASGCKALAGGVLCKANSDNAEPDVYLVNCINTGVISGSVATLNRGGIASETGNNGYFFTCRDYGTGTRSGICALEEKSSGFLGWLRRDKDPMIVNCVDFCGYTGINIISPTATAINNASNANVNSQNYYVNVYSDDLIKIPLNLYESIRGTRLNLQTRAFATTYSYSTSLIGGTNVISDVNYNLSSNAYRNDTSDYYTSLNSGVRIPAYMDMDSKYLNFVYGNYNTNRTLAAPTNLSANVSGGNYRFAWRENNDAYCYEIKYSVVDTNGVVIVADTDTIEKIYGRSFVELPIDKAWSGCRVAFSVRAISGNEMKTGDISRSSSFANITTNAINMLNSPMIHFEYTDDENLVAVLDNQEDYVNENEEFIDCNVQVVFDGVVIDIDPENGYSKKNIKYNNDEEILNVSATALSNESDKYTNSVEMNYDTTLVAVDSIEVSEEAHSVSFDGFYEGKDYEFKYKLHVNNNSSVSDKVIFTDIISYDNELGCEISYSDSMIRLMPNADTEIINTGLLGDYIGKNKIRIINYMWTSDNDSICYGHIAGSGIKKYELSGFIDKSYYKVTNGKCQLVDNDIWEHDAKGNNIELKPGYIIRRNTDGTYDVVYSSMLAMENNVKDGLFIKDYKLASGGNSYISGDESIKIQPAPYIENNLVYQAGRADIIWDKNKNDDSYKNAVYSLKLYVNNSNMNSILVEDISDISQRTYNFEPSNEYPIYEVQVSRVGETDENGRIVKFPSFATRTYVNNIKLSEINVISASLKSDKETATDTDATEITDNVSDDKLDNRICYEVSWEPISSVLENSDCGGYIIMVSSLEEDNKTETHYFNVNVKGGQYDLDGLESIDVSDSYVAGSTSKAIIDLSDFRDGERISVSIMAKANSKAVYYSDGDYGKGFELNIPVRLPVPSSDILTDNWKNCDELQYSDIKENGLVISYFNEIAEDSNESGAYQLAIALYDDVQARYEMKNEESIAKIGDGNENETGYWNSNAIKTLIPKRESKKMLGDIKEGAINFVDSLDGVCWADYSGMWLKVCVKATSDKGVSSLWSDEDSSSDTKAYYWIKIPNVKLSAPVIESFDKSIKIITDNYAEGYVINFGSLDNGEISSETYELYIKKNNNMSYDIYSIGKDKNVKYGEKVLDDEFDEYSGYKKYNGRLDLTNTKITLDYEKCNLSFDGEDLLLDVPSGEDYISVEAVVVSEDVSYLSSDKKVFDIEKEEVHVIELSEPKEEVITKCKVVVGDNFDVLTFDAAVICANIVVVSSEGYVTDATYLVSVDKDGKKEILVDKNILSKGTVLIKFKTMDEHNNVSEWSKKYKLSGDGLEE